MRADRSWATTSTQQRSVAEGSHRRLPTTYAGSTGAQRLTGSLLTDAETSATADFIEYSCRAGSSGLRGRERPTVSPSRRAMRRAHTEP